MITTVPRSRFKVSIWKRNGPDPVAPQTCERHYEVETSQHSGIRDSPFEIVDLRMCENRPYRPLYIACPREGSIGGFGGGALGEP